MSAAQRAWRGDVVLLCCILVCTLAAFGGYLLRGTNDAWQCRAGGGAPTVRVLVQGQEEHVLTLRYDGSEKAGDFLQRVAHKLNVSADYVALFSSGVVVDDARRVVHRRKAQRIGRYPLSWPERSKRANSKTLSQLGVHADDHVLAYLRPLRGDHIHYAFAIFIHGMLVDTLWDQDVLGMPFCSEGLAWPNKWSDLSTGMDQYHIATANPHFGIHTGNAYWFGDGLIHIHPGTSWGWFRSTEGLGATLDAYLSQVGAAYFDADSSQYPLGILHVPHGSARPLSDNMMVLPHSRNGQPYYAGGQYDCGILDPKNQGTKGQNSGGRVPLADLGNVDDVSTLRITDDKVPVASNATHTWRAYYYSYYKQEKPLVLTEGIGSLWLAENLGMIALSFEARSLDPHRTPAPRPPQCMIDVLADKRSVEGKSRVPNQQSSYYMVGFDGYAYPMPNALPYVANATNPADAGVPPHLPPEFAELNIDEMRTAHPWD